MEQQVIPVHKEQLVLLVLKEILDSKVFKDQQEDQLVHKE